MNFRNRFAVLAGSAAVLALAGACNPDLDVTNPNAPDVERAISSGADVRQLIGSSYNTWYLAMQGCLTTCEPHTGIATGVMADNMTMAFGNFGARFNGQEPRLAFGNTSSNADARVGSLTWDGMYSALGATNDGLGAIGRGVRVATSASADDETPAFKAFAQMIQGLTMGYVALVFDKGFVVTEKTPAGEGELVPYQQVNAAAVASLDSAIANSAGQSWSIPTEFTPGISLSAANLNRMANTMAARQLAYVPRTSTENKAVNWGKVLAYAEKGISTGASPFSLQIQGDNGNTWYDITKGYVERQGSWARLDQRVVQLADPSQPVVWTSPTGTPPPFPNIVDKRFAHGTKDSNGDIKQVGADFWFFNSVPFDIARGPYFYSQWAPVRYFEHSFSAPAPFSTLVPYVLAAENDLLIAEGLVRTGGDKARAATLINKTRVTRGGLPALTGGSTNNELLGAIFYERDVELFDTGAGQAWFDRRRIDTDITYNGIPTGNVWGFRGGSNLQKGTPRSLPMPAKELETLGLPVYTFGGDAPNPIFPET